MMIEQSSISGYLGDLFLNGIRCVKSDYIQPLIEHKQVRFPKSKKKRIRNKWAGRSCNYATVSKDVFYQIDGVIYLNPKHFDRLLSTID